MDLPDPGIERVSPALRVDSLPVELPGKLHHHGVVFAIICSGADPSLERRSRGGNRRQLSVQIAFPLGPGDRRKFGNTHM